MKCILCMDKHHGIAKMKKIPWHIKEDFLFFRNVTSYVSKPFKQNIVFMGRNTWESLDKPLNGRANIVLTKSKINDVITVNNIDDIQNYRTSNIENVFVIGGKSLYEHYINKKIASEVIITFLDHDFDCDLKLDLDLSGYELDWKEEKKVMDIISNKMINCTFSSYKKKEKEEKEDNVEELQYLKIMEDIKNNGHYRKTRNANTYSLFGKHMEFDLSDNKFPLLTSKKMAIKSIFKELIFFLTGKTDSKLLEQEKVMIWKGNTSQNFIDDMKLPYKEGDMGPMYGFQWRYFNAEYNGCQKDYTDKGIDQLKEVIDLLKKDKFSRRILMTTYNPSQAKQGVLYPCHGLVVQFGIEGEDNLCCHMYQRSGDWFLGVPFNIASYAFLVHILCMLTDLKPGKLYMSMGDVHIYEQHLEAVNIQLQNKPYTFPKIEFTKKIKDISEINDLTVDDFKFIDYKHHDQIKAPMIA